MAATPFLVRLGDRLAGKWPARRRSQAAESNRAAAPCHRRRLRPGGARDRRDARGDRRSRSWCWSRTCAASRPARASVARCSIGDGSDPRVLRSVATDRAAALVVTLDRPAAAERLVAAVRPLYPDIAIVARGHDGEVSARLRAAGRHGRGAGDPGAQPDHRRGCPARARRCPRTWWRMRQNWCAATIPANEAEPAGRRRLPAEPGGRTSARVRRSRVDDAARSGMMALAATAAALALGGCVDMFTSVPPADAVPWHGTTTAGNPAFPECAAFNFQLGQYDRPVFLSPVVSGRAWLAAVPQTHVGKWPRLQPVVARGLRHQRQLRPVRKSPAAADLLSRQALRCLAWDDRGRSHDAGRVRLALQSSGGACAGLTAPTARACPSLSWSRRTIVSP